MKRVEVEEKSFYLGGYIPKFLEKGRRALSFPTRGGGDPKTVGTRTKKKLMLLKKRKAEKSPKETMFLKRKGWAYLLKVSRIIKKKVRKACIPKKGTEAEKGLPE